MTGSPRESWRAVMGSSARERGCRSRAASSGSRRPLRRIGSGAPAASGRHRRRPPGGRCRRSRPRHRRAFAGAVRTCAHRPRSCPCSSWRPPTIVPAVVLARPPACRRSRGRWPDPVTSAVPTPYPSTGAAASAAMACSSRSPVDDDPGLRRPQRVQLLRAPVRPGPQVAGVDPHRARAPGRRPRPRCGPPRRRRRCRRAGWSPCRGRRPGQRTRPARCRAAG